MPRIRIGTFEHVAKWRAAAAGTQFDQVRVAAEEQLTEALRHVLVMAEEHPQLRASGEFQALEQTLETVEESLRSAWRDYNAAVLDYNRRIRVFPGKLVAGLLGLQPKPLFELSSAAEKEGKQRGSGRVSRPPMAVLHSIRKRG